MGASALPVDMLGRGVCNQGTSVGDCPKRVPAVRVPDGEPEGGGTMGAWVHESNKNEVSKTPQGMVHKLMGCRDQHQNVQVLAAVEAPKGIASQ